MIFLSSMGKLRSAMGRAYEKSRGRFVTWWLFPSSLFLHEHLVNNRVPGIVDADEEQQHSRGADGKESGTGVPEGEAGGCRQRRVCDQWQHRMEQPIFKHRAIRVL